MEALTVVRTREKMGVSSFYWGWFLKKSTQAADSEAGEATKLKLGQGTGSLVLSLHEHNAEFPNQELRNPVGEDSMRFGETCK